MIAGVARAEAGAPADVVVARGGHVEAAPMHMYMYVCMYVCMCIYIYIYI